MSEDSTLNNSKEVPNVTTASGLAIKLRAAFNRARGLPVEVDLSAHRRTIHRAHPPVCSNDCRADDVGTKNRRASHRRGQDAGGGVPRLSPGTIGPGSSYFDVQRLSGQAGRRLDGTDLPTPGTGRRVRPGRHE